MPNLPHRLRELRLELGWSLEDVAARTGVTQRGVVSNWEATNQRRRTPPLGTLLILQRWYGVSMDYLLGLPLAERASPAVKHGRRLLREALRIGTEHRLAVPSDRARLAASAAFQLAPEAFFPERVMAWLGLPEAEFAAIMHGTLWSDAMIQRLSDLLGIPMRWFYSGEAADLTAAAE